MSELSPQWLLVSLYLGGLVLSLWLPQQQWRIAKFATLAGFIAMLGNTLFAIGQASINLVPVDGLGVVMVLLVSLLGWVITRFAHRYLQGEAQQARFVTATLFTLSCVALLVTSQHLLVIVLAWSGTSVGLHRLLTFYPERKAARVVAHKKFLVSRFAEICLLLALGLIYLDVGSLSLQEIHFALNAQDSLPLSLTGAALLLAFAAILKTAQLPLHGWLIQVMEAPTPVSALLHAGVVNMGGFVLLRVAELIGLAPSAQWLLVIVGSLTAVLAG
ncbi:NADH-quinone oxidoreductase subunit L, partial [Vibrio cholerae]